MCYCFLVYFRVFCYFFCCFILFVFFCFTFMFFICWNFKILSYSALARCCRPFQFGANFAQTVAWTSYCPCLGCRLRTCGESSSISRWPHSWPNWPRPFLLVLPKRNHSELSSCHVGMWRTAVCRKTFVADLQSATVLKAGLTQLRATHKTLRCLCIWPRSVVTSPRCAGADCSPREPLALRTAAALQRDDEFVGT